MMAAPNALPYQALKAEARRRNLQVALGSIPGAMIVLQRHARDRKRLTFPDRDSAMAYLRTLPEASVRR